MSTFEKRWQKLRNKRYREEFAAAQVKQLIPLQIRKLLKQSDVSQQALSERAGLTQGVVSRAANPEYGNLTLNTLVRIAAGFDVAFVGKFVPFTELDRLLTNLSEDSLCVESFGQEDNKIRKRAAVCCAAAHGDSARPYLGPFKDSASPGDLGLRLPAAAEDRYLGAPIGANSGQLSFPEIGSPVGIPESVAAAVPGQTPAPGSRLPLDKYKGLHIAVPRFVQSGTDPLPPAQRLTA